MGMAVSPNSPRLAPPSGRFLQFVLATLPLFAVLLYLLYQVYDRPNHVLYNLPDLDDDAKIQNIYDNADPLVPLVDMIPIFLVFEFLFGLMAAYVFIYIPKRHQLIGSYLSEGEPCLGDVTYKPRPWNRCGGFHYGDAVYAYPHAHNWRIKKRVRMFQLYTREKVTILLLPTRPFSGQPKSDIEVDVQASSRSVDQSRKIGYFSLAWVIFTLVSPLFILYQMNKVHEIDPYEDLTYGWRLYLIGGLGVIPAVVIFGIIAHWSAYRHHLVHRGQVLKDDSDGKNDQGETSEDKSMPSVLWAELMDPQSNGVVPSDSFSTSNSVLDDTDAYISMDHSKRRTEP